MKQARKSKNDPVVTLSLLKTVLVENNKVLIDAIDKRFEPRFTGIEERINRIDIRLGNLEDKVDLLDKKVDIRTGEILDAVQKFVGIVIEDNLKSNLTPHNFVVS